VIEANAHMVDYELAAVAALSGVQIRPVSTPDGRLTANLVREALRPASPHTPQPSAVAVENTHNASGGRVLPPGEMAAIVAVGRAAGLELHLDGARLWNAATALQVSPARLVLGVTTVMVSYSKGLRECSPPGWPIVAPYGWRHRRPTSS
jgi:threonine aldolase